MAAGQLSALAGAAAVERLGTEKIGKLLWEMSSQTTFSLLVYAIYSITDTWFLSVGVNSLAAAGASIISPVLIALGGVATIVGVGGASVVSRALGEGNAGRASRTVANTFLIFWCVALAITVAGTLLIEPLVYLLGRIIESLRILVRPHQPKPARLISAPVNQLRSLLCPPLTA